MADSDRQRLYGRIWHGANDGLIDIGADLKALNRPECPVFRKSDVLLPWIAAALATGVGWHLAGWLGALGALLGMIILIGTTLNFMVLMRLRKRALAMAMSGLDGFETLWALGGLSLRLKDDDASEINAPDGDWRAFARGLPQTEEELEP